MTHEVTPTPNGESISLFLSHKRACIEAAKTEMSKDERWQVLRGICQWSDGSIDHGFKIRILNIRTRAIRFV